MGMIKKRKLSVEEFNIIIDIEKNLCVKVAFISDVKIHVRPKGLKIEHLDKELVKKSVEGFAGGREVVMI